MRLRRSPCRRHRTTHAALQCRCRRHRTTIGGKGVSPQSNRAQICRIGLHFDIQLRRANIFISAVKTIRRLVVFRFLRPYDRQHVTAWRCAIGHAVGLGHEGSIGLGKSRRERPHPSRSIHGRHGDERTAGGSLLDKQSPPYLNCRLSRLIRHLPPAAPCQHHDHQHTDRQHAAEETSPPSPIAEESIPRIRDLYPVISCSHYWSPRPAG
jgi:hypothetical protein